MLASLVQSKDMYLTVEQLFELGTPKSYTEIYDRLRAQGVSSSHSFDLTVWIIGLAKAVQAEWIQNRLRRYRIKVYGYEWECCGTEFSKETYEYWLTNDIADYVFNGNSFEEGDVPEEHDFNRRGEWYEVGGGDKESGIDWCDLSFAIQELVDDRALEDVSFGRQGSHGTWVGCDIEEVPYQNPNAPESYGVRVFRSARGTVAVGDFEISEDFDVNKLTFTADCDPDMGEFLDRHSGITYQISEEDLVLACELRESTPINAEANLYKGSEITIYQVKKLDQ